MRSKSAVLQRLSLELADRQSAHGRTGSHTSSGPAEGIRTLCLSIQFQRATYVRSPRNVWQTKRQPRPRYLCRFHHVRRFNIHLSRQDVGDITIRTIIKEPFVGSHRAIQKAPPTTSIVVRSVRITAPALSAFVMLLFSPVGSPGEVVPALGLLLDVAPVLKLRGAISEVIKLAPMTDRADISFIVSTLDTLNFVLQNSLLLRLRSAHRKPGSTIACHKRLRLQNTVLQLLEHWLAVWV